MEDQKHQTLTHKIVDPLVRPVRLAAYRSKLYLRLLAYGKTALSKGNHAQALRFFERAHLLKPGSRTLAPLSWAYALMGNTKKARELALESHQLNQNHAGPMNDYGCFLLQEGEVDLAISWFEKAKRASFNPRPEMAHINCARAHVSQKNYRLALKEFKSALDLVPGHQEILEIMGKLKKKISELSRYKRH